MKFLFASLSFATLCGCAVPAAAQTPAVSQLRGGADIAYTLPRDAPVSLNILDSKGWIVRELLRGQNQKKGAQVVHWDGLDASGAPMPPGQYGWKLLHHAGVRAEYQLSIAASGQPNHVTKDGAGRWGGAHGNPLSVRADAGGMYLTWQSQEGGQAFSRTDYDGKIIYKIGNSFPFGGSYDAAIVGDTLYRVEVARANYGRKTVDAYVMKFNARSGKTADWEAKDAAIGRHRLNITPQNTAVAADFDTMSDLFMAADGQHVAVSFPRLNRVSIYAASGRKIRDLEMASPQGLAFLPDGRLAICQRGRVEATEATGGPMQPLITQDLDTPAGITLAPDARSLWITDRGESHQIKQFDLSGKLLQTWGKKGGYAAEGRLDRAQFRDPRGIAVGADGNIYITEDNPLRRIARLSPQGKVLREWFGPLGPQRTVWPNLNDLSEVYYNGSNGYIIQAKVDYAHKAWEPMAWYKANGSRNGQPVVFERGGRKWLDNSQGTISVYLPEKDRWQPAVVVVPEDFSGNNEHNKTAFIWTDFNGNSQRDEGEVESRDAQKFAKENGFGLKLHHARVDPQTWVMNAVYGDELVRITPQRITPAGLPVYTLDNIKRVTKTRMATGEGAWSQRKNNSAMGNVPAPDGGFFSAYNGGPPGGQTAWDKAAWNYLVKFDAQGNVQWKAGVHGLNKKVAPGELRYISRVNGVSHDMVFFADVEPANIHAYTTDGLFVASLMSPYDYTGNTMSVEQVTGIVADDPKTGEPYLFAGDTHDGRIWKIENADTLRRLSGTLTLQKAELPLTAGNTGKAGVYTIAYTKTPEVRESKVGVYKGISVDGTLTEGPWATTEALPLLEDGALVGKFHLLRDDQNLYVGAQVTDASPAKNGAQDPEQAFIGGDAVDLYFGSTASSVRVLLTPNFDKAILFRPKVGADGEKKPYTFASPVSRFTMDFVGLAKAGQVIFAPHRNGQGYTMEASIPLSELPELGTGSTDTEIGFDIGLVFSNPGGNDRESRLYWHQRSVETSSVVDIPSEARLFPNLWGRAIMKGAK